MWPSRNNQLACSGNRRSISSEMRMFGILRYVLLLSRTDVIALDAVLRPGGGCLGEVGWREETVSVPGLASTLPGRPAGWLVLQACTPWDFPSCLLPSLHPTPLSWLLLWHVHRAAVVSNVCGGHPVPRSVRCPLQKGRHGRPLSSAGVFRLLSQVSTNSPHPSICFDAAVRKTQLATASCL